MAAYLRLVSPVQAQSTLIGAMAGYGCSSSLRSGGEIVLVLLVPRSANGQPLAFAGVIEQPKYAIMMVILYFVRATTVDGGCSRSVYIVAKGANLEDQAPQHFTFFVLRHGVFRLRAMRLSEGIPSTLQGVHAR